MITNYKFYIYSFLITGIMFILMLAAKVIEEEIYFDCVTKARRVYVGSNISNLEIEPNLPS